jgi:hypothetical protein
MVVELGKPIDGCSAKPAGNRHIVNSLCDAELFDYECTMIECPFQAGDEVKANTDEWGFIGTVKEIGEQDLFVAYCGGVYVAPKSCWLHSNPDLRSKGEV